MARTPLLRAFQRLAAEHRAAERLGDPARRARGRAIFTRRVPQARGRDGAAVAIAGPTLLATARVG